MAYRYDGGAASGALHAAEFLIEGDGVKLLSLAAQMADEKVAPHNAQQRLAALAGHFLDHDSATAAALLAWTMAINRGKAVAKLGTEVGAAALFDGDGLQMASSQAASRYHAQLLAEAGARHVIDMTAGIGGDSLAFARAGMQVIAYENDPLRAAFLSANVNSFGFSNQISVREQDSTSGELPMAKAGVFVFLDPPRRTESSRWGNEDVADRMIEHALGSGADGALVKLAPAVERGIGGRFGGDLEFLSIDGECKEALLRLGALRLSRGEPAISAVLLPSGERIDALPGVPISSDTGDLSQARFLYEPDPAVIRAGLIDTLAMRHELQRIDPDVAYLIGDKPIVTSFAAGYEVLAAFPYHRRSVQAWLDENGASLLIVKKRGVPDDPETVRKQFKMSKGPGRTAILALTRQGRRVWALMLSPLA